MTMMTNLSRRILSYTKTSKEQRAIEARLKLGSNTKAADETGIPRRTVDRIVNRVVERAVEDGAVEAVRAPRTAVIDIERAPMKSYLWSFWNNNNVPTTFQVSNSYTISWAAKWLGETDIMADAICYNPDYTPGSEDDARMLKGIWDILNEADFVVAHNGDRFDIKHLNTHFLLAGMKPPNPYKSIDTLKMVKRTFAFDSNKLDYLLHRCFGERKTDVGGFDTWVACMNGDMSAWERLVAYNKDDVTQLEKLYLYIRSWDRLHPSAATWGGTSDEPVCTVCGSENVHQTEATTATNVSVFPVWECGDCGAKLRGRTSIVPKKQRASLLVKANP